MASDAPRRLALTAIVLAAIWPSISAAASHTPRVSGEAASLEGQWTNASLTQLERPAGFDALTIPEARAVEFEKNGPQAFLSVVDPVGGRQSEWWELGGKLARIDGQPRTSWLVEPADGKLPYSEAGRRMLGARNAAILGAFDGPEVRPPTERCLTGGSGGTGAPILTAPYSSQYQIVQTADHVAILAEINHEARIIRLKDATRPPADVRRWMGDSVGHWEGKTLVVETTHFNPGEAFKPPVGVYISEDAHVVERFTRISPTQLRYAFTVDDPKTFSRPWRAEVVWEAAGKPMFEYACHEGNYGMEGILAGARQTEAAARARAAN